MNQELCDQCKLIDKMVNGGAASDDIFIVCEHLKKNGNRVGNKDYGTGLTRDERYLINKIKIEQLEKELEK
jgi:hypothetical protein